MVPGAGVLLLFLLFLLLPGSARAGAHVARQLRQHAAHAVARGIAAARLEHFDSALQIFEGEVAYQLQHADTGGGGGGGAGAGAGGDSALAIVLFNQAPYAIIARKSRGIKALADMEGKNLGVAEGDLSIRLWPAVARQNGIKLSSVKQNTISAAVREPMLSAGQVDAVTGFSYLSAINLRDRGVPADDLAVLRFADYGCEAYGFAVIVSPRLATAKPDAVKGFVRAVIGGTNLAIKDPARAATEVASRMDGGSRDLELERLTAIIRDNILTAEVKRNGIGSIEAERFERSLDQLTEDVKFQKRPQTADIFDDQFLPPIDGRLVN